MFNLFEGVFFMFSGAKTIHFFLKRDIMQLFREDAIIFSKVAHNRPKIFVFSIANWSKTSPNLVFCSIKVSPSATSI